jgi:hypothetical protein
MDIIGALKQEESKLHRQLNAVQGAIAALKGETEATARTMSAAVRARISRTAKARWAKIRAERSVKKTSK